MSGFSRTCFRLLQVIQLPPRIARKWRVREFLHKPVERLLGITFLARVHVDAAQTHQHAVDRHIAIFALRQFLECVDRLLVLSGLRLSLRETQFGHLAVEAVPGTIDHLLIRRLRTRWLAELHVGGRLSISREDPGIR